MCIRSDFLTVTLWQVGDQQNNVGVELEYEDEASASQIHAFKSQDESSVQVGYMQSVTPNVVLGGSGSYSFRQGSLERALGGMYTLGDHVIAAQWDHQVSRVDSQGRCVLVA